MVGDKESIQYLPGENGNCREVARFLGLSPMCAGDCPEDMPFFVRTPEGQRVADAGDWIVRISRGVYYPVKPEDFESIS